MEITQSTIPHIFRNKYLRAGGSTINNNGSSVYSSTGGGGTGTGNCQHAIYADIAEEAKHLSRVLNMYGNAWSGTTDLEAISATTIQANSITTEELQADEASIGELSGTTATFDELNADEINSTNITNSDTIKTHNLEVTGLAHFFELVIDKIKAAGGAIMLTPADGFVVNKVSEIEGGYRLYWRSTDENGKGIMNMWKVGDQAMCRSFNEASVGTSYNVSNKYYWSLVTAIDEAPVEVDFSGETHDCHYIDISTTTKDGSVNPEVDDEIVMCGYRGEDDETRQSAILISAYSSLDKGLTAPLFAEYKGINDFDLESHRCSYIDATGAHFVGEFMVDNSTTIEDYINQQFIINAEGLVSRVTKVINPNILAANGWKDQDDRNVLQENEEDFTVSASTPSEEEVALLADEEEDELVAYPPVMYLDEGDYTMSVYARAKYHNISYGQTKNNLDYSLPVSTMINFKDTWHTQPRSIINFHAPVNGYYQLGIQPMDDTYSGDTPYIDYTNPSGSTSGGTEEPDNPDIPGSGDEPDNPTTGTTGNTIQTVTTFTLPRHYYGVGYTVQGTASVEPNGYVGSIMYSTTDPEILSVDKDGKVTFHKIGTAKASATACESYYGGKHYLSSKSSFEVNVVASMPSKITIKNKLAGLKLEETYQLQVEVEPSGYNGAITYTSSNPSIATVSSTGLVTCVGIGNTTITANLSGVEFEGIDYSSSSDSYQLNVEDNITYVDTTIRIKNNIEAVYPIDSYIELETEVTPSSYNGTITYTSSDESVAIVEDNYLEFIGEGDVTITATANGYRKNKVVYLQSQDTITTKCSEMVDYTTSIQLLNNIESSYEGATCIQLNVKVTPESYNDYGGGLTYATSDSNVAKVNSSGYLEILEAGTATITITAPEIYDDHKHYTKATMSFNITSVGYDESIMPKNEIWYSTLNNQDIYIMLGSNMSACCSRYLNGDTFLGDGVSFVNKYFDSSKGVYRLVFNKTIEKFDYYYLAFEEYSGGKWSPNNVAKLTGLYLPSSVRKTSYINQYYPNITSSYDTGTLQFQNNIDKFYILAPYNPNIKLPIDGCKVKTDADFNIYVRNKHYNGYKSAKPNYTYYSLT